jgi:hypothetical protein
VSQPQPIPWHALAALLSCAVLAALVGAGASGEIGQLRHLSEAKHLLPALPMVTPEALAKAEAVKRASMFGMRTSRLVVLTLLCITCMVTFISVLRLWRSSGLPRAGMLRLASFAALGCALLRTIDGAQDAVIFRRIYAVLAEGLSPDIFPAMTDPQKAQLLALWPDVQLMVHVGLTAVVAGAFAVLSQYFRSQRAQKLFTSGDPA